MTSPFLFIANAYVVVTQKGPVTNVDGRFVETPGDTLAVQCYLGRQQYNSVSSGSVKQPLPSQQGGTMMPGASGDQFYYRGYALRTAPVAVDWAPGDSATWADVTASIPALRPGTEVTFYFGAEPAMRARVERNTGKYGGAGPDQTLYAEVGGVELQLVGAELLN